MMNFDEMTNDQWENQCVMAKRQKQFTDTLEKGWKYTEEGSIVLANNRVYNENAQTQMNTSRGLSKRNKTPRPNDWSTTCKLEKMNWYADEYQRKQLLNKNLN